MAIIKTATNKATGERLGFDDQTQQWGPLPSQGVQTAVEQSIKYGTPIQPPGLGQKALSAAGTALEYADVPFKPLHWLRSKAEQGMEAVAPGITKPIEVPIEAMGEPAAMGAGGGPMLSGETVMAPGAGQVALELGELAAYGPYTRAGMALGKLGGQGLAAGVRAIGQAAKKPYNLPVPIGRTESVAPLFEGGLDLPPGARGFKLDPMKTAPEGTRGVQRFDPVTGAPTGPIEPPLPRTGGAPIIGEGGPPAGPPLAEPTADPGWLTSSADALLQDLYGGAKAAAPTVAPEAIKVGEQLTEVPKPPWFRPNPAMENLAGMQRTAGQLGMQERLGQQLGRTGFAPPSAVQPPGVVPRERWGTETARLQRAIGDIQRLRAIMGAK